MKKATNTALVPKFRFPEFRAAPEWEQKSLGSVAFLRNGYAFKSSEYVDWGPYQIITIANVQQGLLLLHSTKRIEQLPSDIQQHQVLCLGDILISMTGNVGRVCRVSAKGLLLNQRVGKLIPEMINHAFLYEILQQDAFRNAMQLKAAGGAQGNLSAGDITEYGFSIPTDPGEQQKIAECLGSLDELISAESQKLDALKAHKKGLMQQLFPRDGETRPRLRLPEFQGSWNVEHLGGLGHFSGGGTPNRAVPEYWTGNIPWISSSDLQEDDIFSVSISRYITGDAVSESATKRVKKGSVLFVSRVGTGKVAIAPVDLCTSQDFTNFVPRDLLNHYVAYYFIANKHALHSLGQGTSIKGFAKSDLESFKLVFPCLPEQRRIAACLSSLDELIAAQGEKVAALKAHKKGLMQQLFPSPAEVGA